jgi:hypothetical protein
VPVGRGIFIWDVTFRACSRLTEFTVETQNPFYSSRGGVLFNKDETTLVEWPPGRTGACTVPNSVTSIGEQAFYLCSGLTDAYFQGNAPSSLGWGVFANAAPRFSIFYPSTTSGWSTPTWNGYPAQPYNQPSVLSLIRGLGTLTPSFNHLRLGTNYQLQVSTDLSTWSNTGPVFTATNTSEAYPQPFGVTNGNRLFFRLRSAP